MFQLKHKIPETVKVLLVTAITTAMVIGFGEYLFWTKPLHDQLKQSQKDVATLKDQVETLSNIANKAQRTYANQDYGFTFTYPDTYELTGIVSTADIRTSLLNGAFESLHGKDGDALNATMWIGVKNSESAQKPETNFKDRVITSETKVGKDLVAATSFTFLPGRGQETYGSMNAVQYVVPLKKVPSMSLVLTNIGDVDLATFQAVVTSLQITK